MKLLKIPSLLLLVGAFVVGVQGGIILESKCSMDLVLDRNDSASSTMQRLAQIEREAEAYFEELLAVESETNVQLSNVLKVYMAVEQDRWTPDNTITLSTTISLVYRSAVGWPLMLDEVLDDVITRYTIPAGLNFAEYPVEEFHFRGVKDDSKILFVEEGHGKSGSQKGLIVAVSFLSVILIMVSSVLLYITGGWDALHQAFTNCLLEEVDDDDDQSNYLARSKSTFQVQSTDEDDNENDDDEESGSSEEEDGDLEDASLDDSTTSGQQTPKGMLGAMPVTQGLGIKTPNPNGTFNGDFTPTESEITDMTDKPMGITSMRKMPAAITPRVGGGLSHLIMKRLNHSNKKQ